MTKSGAELLSQFSSMPRNAEELATLLSFGENLDRSRVFPSTASSTSRSSVVQSVFGNPKDTVFHLKARLIAAEGGKVYDLIPHPLGDVYKVELIFSDNTLRDNVFLTEDGSIESDKTPVFARVKSPARKIAFTRLCAQPCTKALHASINEMQQRMQVQAVSWSAVSYDAFTAILDIVKDPLRQCKDVKLMRDRLCSVRTGSKVKTHVLVEAFLKSAAQPEACPICVAASHDIRSHQNVLNAAIGPVLESIRRLHVSFFMSFEVGTASREMYPLLSFSPRGCEAKSRLGYEQTVKQCLDKTLHPVISADDAFATVPLTSSSLLRWCGRYSRAARLRDVSGPDFSNRIEGHWNDACVTAHVCEELKESVLTRLLVITPETDAELVLAIARDLQDLARHAVVLEAAFGRCMRACCASVDVDMCALDVSMLDAVTAHLDELKGKAQKLMLSMQRLSSAVENAACFDGVLSRVLNTEYVARARSCKEEEKKARTLCPLGNAEFLCYSNDGTTKIKRAASQHASFGQAEDGRIFCVHPSCVVARGGRDGMPVSESDMLAFVRSRVDAGTLKDPVQDFLANEGRCRVCRCSTHFAVVADGSSIACTKCKATVHTACELSERHDEASGCVNPAAGVLTSIETGAVTCLGCGLVLCDYVCIDTEPDERVFHDEGEDPTHQSAAASPFLSNGSNVTFISRVRGADVVDTKTFNKYAWMHGKMNKYVLAEDAMRLTTWVKRDSHVKWLQEVILDATASGLLQLTKMSQDVVMQRFRDIRWSSEKMYNIRLAAFALVACEVIESRERLASIRFHEFSTCSCCGLKLSYTHVAKHLRQCRQSQTKLTLKRKTYNKFSEQVLFC